MNDNAQIILKELEVHYDEVDEKIKRVHEIVMKLLTMSDTNIRDRSFISSSIAQSFLTAFYGEKRRLVKLEKSLVAAKEEYVSKFGKQGIAKFITVQEAEKSKEVKEIEEKISGQKELVSYLQETCKITSGFNFAVKNAVELIKVDSTGHV